MHFLPYQTRFSHYDDDDDDNSKNMFRYCLNSVQQINRRKQYSVHDFSLNEILNVLCAYMSIVVSVLCIYGTDPIYLCDLFFC